MAAALLSKEENTVLIFAGRSLSELLNNAALIYLHVVGSTSHASVFSQLQMFLIGFTSGFKQLEKNAIPFVSHHYYVPNRNKKKNHS